MLMFIRRLKKVENQQRRTKKFKKIIAEINSDEKELPGTISSINSMIINLMKSKLNEEIQSVKLNEIYEYLEKELKSLFLQVNTSSMHLGTQSVES